VNRERRKVLGSIFADAAKYTLTVGVIGGLLTDKITVWLGVGLGVAFGLLVLLAYGVTPPDS